MLIIFFAICLGNLISSSDILPKQVDRLGFRLHFQPKQLLNYLEDHKDILQFLSRFPVHIQISEDALGSTRVETLDKVL